MRRSWRLAMVAVVLAASSCRSDGSPEPVNLPPAPPVVEITMQEYSFKVPDGIPAGRVVFRLRNAGEAHHRPALLPLDEELPPLDEQIRGTERATVSPFAGTRTRAPGATGLFAVDLAPDTRYGLVCFVRDDVVGSHALQGMYHEFRTPKG